MRSVRPQLLRPIAGCLAAGLALLGLSCIAPVRAGALASTHRYAVLLDAGVEVLPEAKWLSEKHGFAVRHVYQHALHGLAADLTPAQAEDLRAEPHVSAVTQDGLVAVPSFRSADPLAGPGLLQAGRQPKQTTPTSIARSGAARSRTAAINGRDEPFPVDVAVIDTGIDSTHPDLNVVGGVSLLGGTPDDANDHGTNIAGVIGARDNRIGVVGVAPGARLWSVRVLDASGFGAYTDIAAGVDWVTARAATIRVANISLVGEVTGSDILRTAISGCGAAGVTIVAAAGNSAQDCVTLAPAGFDTVITVSALADSNGKAGRSAGRFRVGGLTDIDETFAVFSNFGSPVDIIAPGAQVFSCIRGGRYGAFNGTSQAAAHVTGAAALILRNNPNASPAQVRAALLGAAVRFGPPDDPDGTHEPALECSRL